MSTTVTWETRNLQVALEGLKRGARDFSAKRARKLSEIAFEEAIKIAHEELRPRQDRAKKDGPSYLDSFQLLPTRIDGVSDRISFGIGNSAPHAAVIEVGQKPHEIAPHGRWPIRYPAWRAYRDGVAKRWPVGRAVMHPGADGHHILRRAMNSAVQQQRRIF